VNQFLTSAGALALVKAVVDLVKYFKAKDTNGYVTQVATWAAGVGSVYLLKYSDVADTFKLGAGAVTLDTASTATVILAGLGLGSGAMLVNDVKKALDNNDSAAKPDLIGPPPPAARRAPARRAKTKTVAAP
jgi:hypothetical protein